MVCKKCKYFKKSSLNSDFDKCTKFDTYTFISRKNNDLCSEKAIYFQPIQKPSISCIYLFPSIILFFLKFKKY